MVSNGANTGSSQSIQVTTRSERSAMMFQMQHLAKPIMHIVIKAPKVPAPAGSTQLTPHRKALKRCTVKERKVAGFYVYDITSKEALWQASEERKCPRRRMFYFAGGGWQSPPTSEHWVLLAEYAVKMPDVVITLVSYPLAPKSAAPVAFPQILNFYRQAMSDAQEADEEVMLAGDSAGGNIVLAVTIAALLEQPDSPCPKSLFVISPSTDLRRCNPDMKTLEKHDPLLRGSFVKQTADAWRAEWDADDVRVSPLHADVSVLARRSVRVHGVTGGYDILSPDGVLFREKCNKAGVEGKWLHWEKQMHCFPLAFSFKLPESVEAKDWIIDVLRQA